MFKVVPATLGKSKKMELLPLDPKTMKNEGFNPSIYGL